MKKLLPLILSICIFVCPILTGCDDEGSDDGKFSPVSDFKFELVDGGVSVMSYSGTDTEIYIPEKADGKKVVAISKEAFAKNTEIEKVVISDTVEYIDQGAFLYCINLKSVEIPGNVETIGVSAFYLCKKLSDVKIGDGVEKIEQFAFIECYDLKSLYVPESVKEIGAEAIGMRYIEDEKKSVIIDGFELECESGSVAEIYAKQFNIKYSEPA